MLVEQHFRIFMDLQETARQNDYSARWLALDVNSRGKVKQEALMTLGSQSAKAGTFASQVVAAIAAVELPQGQWPELIELLLGFVNNATNTTLRIATLQTIGFICETIVRIVCPVIGG
jgi:importin subunit beta-1